MIDGRSEFTNDFTEMISNLIMMRQNNKDANPKRVAEIITKMQYPLKDPESTLVGATTGAAVRIIIEICLRLGFSKTDLKNMINAHLDYMGKFTCPPIGEDRSE